LLPPPPVFLQVHRFAFRGRRPEMPASALQLAQRWTFDVHGVTIVP
jgi:hypothetical protein